MAIIYALTNEAIIDPDENHPLVKIGITDQPIEKRMQGLNTGVPKPYDCFAALEVGDMARARKIERLILDAFKKDRVEKKEFLRLDKGSVLSIFEALAISEGIEDETPLPENTIDREEHNSVVERRKNFTFEEVGIETGTILRFKWDDETTCKVIGDKKVLFRGKETSLSDSAAILLKEMGSKRKNEKAVAGPLYWYHEGCSLDELRKE